MRYTDYDEDDEIADDDGEYEAYIEASDEDDGADSEQVEGHDHSNDISEGPSSHRRAWILLLIVLILGVLVVSVLFATRPLPPLPPTMKPPWMV
jgi:hypothetical protein